MRCRHPLRTKKTHPPSRSPLRDSMCHTVIFYTESKPEKKKVNFKWKVEGKGVSTTDKIDSRCLVVVSRKVLQKKTLSHFNVKVNFSRPMKPIRQNPKSQKNQKNEAPPIIFALKSKNDFFDFRIFLFCWLPPIF